MAQGDTDGRPECAALDAILGKSFPVLDDGFVRVVDYMGTDSSIVQAARVSYGKGTQHVSRDRQLIRYLLRHYHTTPFEMCELKLHLRVPMDCWRQWIRHRTASVNEYSTRYSLAIDSAQTTKSSEWRIQSVDNKQGSAGFMPPEEGAAFTSRETELQRMAYEVYMERVNAGIAREQARKDLPLSTYTEAYWKTNLHNLLHFLQLRSDNSAQLEIRTYADVIGEEIVRKWVPLTWEAFTDYRMGSVFFSRLEVDMMAEITRGDSPAARDMALEAGWLKRDDNGVMKKGREACEFDAKLIRVGMPSSWSVENK